MGHLAKQGPTQSSGVLRVLPCDPEVVLARMRLRLMQRCSSTPNIAGRCHRSRSSSMLLHRRPHAAARLLFSTGLRGTAASAARARRRRFRISCMPQRAK